MIPDPSWALERKLGNLASAYAVLVVWNLILTAVAIF
jgi:hypothetical protein